MKKVCFVTGNANKLRELKAVLGEKVELTSQAIDLLEIQGTPVEISVEKCKLASKHVGGAVLVEDTCLEFDALGGMPGPYVKWFLDKIGPKGLCDLLAAFPNKKARAVCTMAFSEGPGHEPKVFQGIVHGKIVEPRGNNNFGWDPIFQPDGHEGTYAELPAEIKHAISHRTLAINRLLEYFDNPEEKKQKQ